MEGLVFLFIIVCGMVLLMPIAALVSANGARRRAEELTAEMGRLREQQVRLLQRLELLETPAQAPPPPVVQPEVATAPACSLPPLCLEPPQIEPPPAPIPEPRPPVRQPVTPTPPPSSISLEQFMGAKLFAWVGGLALFLGIIFFVKLSIERGWISPELRTAIGFMTGAGLVCGGVVMQKRRQYTTLAHALCATGVVILYGVTFAAHALWRIPPLHHSLVAFSVMALITVAAFLLAVRMNAQVVAILGMLGGFLTPILCSTGRDQPLGLFTYIALLDIGVLAVARHRRWLHLTALAALGTVFMQAGWMGKFFHSSQYAVGSATWVPVTVFLGFAALFMLAAWRSRHLDDDDGIPAKSALSLCLTAMVAAFVFLDYGAITERPVLLYAFVLGINVVTMMVVWHAPRMIMAQAGIAALTFIHLSLWTTERLTAGLLPQALGIYLAFGLLQTAFVVLMQRKTSLPAPLTGWVPVLTLVLLLMPVLSLNEMSFMIWPAVLLVDLLIITLAVVSGLLLPVLAALVLTLFTAGAWLLRWPAQLSYDMVPFLFVVGGFAVLFGIAGSFLARRMPKAAFAPLLPVSSAVLPFLLLILATLRLQIANPSPIFGLALLLALFLLGLVRVAGVTVLAPTALGCVLALEWAWHGQSFDARHADAPLLWYLLFYGLFTAFPFVFQKQFATRKLPWITSAAAGVGTFSLVYRLAGQAWPNDMMGLLPAAFALAPLAGLVWVLKQHSAENPARLDQLAWFGGVALFFITLIFPIQFEKQWVTIGWALEGAALCWLFRRVPHPGLRATGTLLLIISFVRLTLNPAVLEYQLRGDTAILNWQLYAYSATALALFMAAKWLTPPAHLWNDINLRGLFCSLGGTLLFLLLNIEIADVFTPAGSRSIVFDFDGNLARDMTYSIAWGLFALTLLVLGIWKRNPPTRYAGIGLLAVTLLKLFLHDLATIDSGYRIGALIGVAVIALLASFLYQRFLTEENS
ncbi:MAG: DUF2339 domain-containing protein [Prosthecobacter sp.]